MASKWILETKGNVGRFFFLFRHRTFINVLLLLFFINLCFKKKEFFQDQYIEPMSVFNRSYTVLRDSGPRSVSVRPEDRSRRTETDRVGPFNIFNLRILAALSYLFQRVSLRRIK